jgi:hypothetical protein
MACKYVKDFDFPEGAGFSGSCGKVNVKGYLRGGKVAKPMCEGGRYKEGGEVGKSDLAQDKALIKKAFKQHDKQEHKGGKGTELKLKKGGVIEKDTGERYASRKEMMKHEREESPSMKREEMMKSRSMVNRDPRVPLIPPTGGLGMMGMKSGGKFQSKVGKVMGEFKEGKLHSGGSDKTVKNPKQAIAIALSEARRVSGKK